MGGYSGRHTRLHHRVQSAASIISTLIQFNTQEESEAFARLNADFDSRRDLILAKYAARKGAG